jgi:hypothetical protein
MLSTNSHGVIAFGINTQNGPYVFTGTPVSH